MRAGFWFCAAAIACLPLAVSVAAYREGPLPAMTGGFGEQSCRTCHFDKPLNEPAGRLQLLGVPAQYEAGREYTLTVSIKRSALRVAGFEMTARVADGSRKGQQAGSLSGSDDRTRVIFAPGQPVQYLQHTKTGSTVTIGEGRWTVRWVAPSAAVGNVIFHVAANASNDDASPLGDFIYLTTLTSRAK